MRHLRVDLFFLMYIEVVYIVFIFTEVALLIVQRLIQFSKSHYKEAIVLSSHYISQAIETSTFDNCSWVL